jgi:hypothetical protein
MNWTAATAYNQKRLTLIVAEIFALIGLVSGGRLEWLSQLIYLKALRLLRPTESALRRLLVLASAHIIVKPSLQKPFPIGKIIERKQSDKISFQLCDQRFAAFPAAPKPPPLVKLVRTTTANPFNIFDAMYQPWPEKPERFFAATMILRLEAVKAALENLPHQALRMARWLQRRKTRKDRFTEPLRLGPAPGYSKEAKTEINEILYDLHFHARGVLKTDTS